MPRERRVFTTGYYHIANRGVGLGEVFLRDEDRIFFITQMCTLSKHFEFNIHGYALLSNGYDLLVETTKNNLPHIMKAINGQYTSYFNRKYSRRGYLWEGRYQSWQIEDAGFVLEILAYIENLPVQTGIATEKSRYSFSSYRQFIGIDERLPCLKKSIVFSRFNTLSEIKEFFGRPVDTDRIHRIHRLLKKQSRNKAAGSVEKRLPPLCISEFDTQDTLQRNIKIYEAYKLGYSQANIGRTIGISQQAVHKIIKKFTNRQNGRD
ncbi:transposase [Hydrogenimonas sp.]